MKKRNIAIVSTLTALTIGLCSLSILKINSNNIDKASASRETAFTGIYKKVTSASELTTDPITKVLLMSDTNEVIRDAGGNPGYLYTTNENIYVSHDENFVYANNAYVVELTVYEGSKSGSIALGGYYRMGWGAKGEKLGYIGWDDRGSSPSHGGSIDWSDVGIGYWKDDTGLRKNIIDDSSWYVSFEDGHIVLDNVGGHGRLGMTYGYDKRIVFWGIHNLNLYKLVDPVSMSIATQPTKISYVTGEKLNLTGLDVEVTFSGLGQYSFDYKNNKDFFIVKDYATGSGYVEIPVWFVNKIAKNITIFVSQHEQRYMHVSEDIGDYRGNCILATYYPDGDYSYSALGFRIDNGNVDTRAAGVIDGSISILSSARKNSADFELIRINGKYRLAKTLEGNIVKYVGSNGSEAELQNSVADSNALQAEYDSTNHCVYLKLYETSYYLNYEGFYFSFSNNAEHRAELYKQELTDEEYTSINTFVSGFHNATKVCVADGRSLNLTTEVWTQQATAFDALSSGAQSVIAGATYTHNSEAYGSLEDIADRYDYIISKYSQFNDFMSRKDTTSYENNYAQSANMFLVNIKQNSTAIIILAVSIVTLSSLGLVLIIKRRKALSK